MRAWLQRGTCSSQGIINKTQDFQLLSRFFCYLVKIVPTAPAPGNLFGHLWLVRHNSDCLYKNSSRVTSPPLGMRRIPTFKKLKTSVQERALDCWQLWAKVEAPNIMLQRLNWEHLNAWFYLCLKKPVAAQLPDVGGLQHVARGHGISHAVAGDHASKGDDDLLS